MVDVRGLKTGDVLVCYGRGLLSAIISWLTPRWAIWRPAPSHVAIIAVHDGDVYVHESTSLSGLKDAIDGTHRKGVQAHLLSQWLAHYPGKVYLRRLKVAMPRASDCVDYLLSLHARKVHYDARKALHSASPVLNSATGDPLFCAALVGFALQKGGSIGTHVNCNELHPLDIDRLACLREREILKG